MTRIHRQAFLLLATLIALAAPAMARAATSGMTADLLNRMDRLNDASVSPDGRYIAYVVRTISPDLSRVSTHILIADQDRPGAPHVQIAGAPARQDMPAWSGDGRTLYFRGPDAKGVLQLWRMRIGGTAAQLSKAPIDVGSFQIAPDERFAVASFRVYPDCPTLDCTAERAAKPQVATLYKTMTVRFYDSYGDGRYNGLFKVRFEGGAAVPLMPGFEADAPSRPSGSSSAFTISPDSKRLIFAARRSGVSPNISTTHRLFEVALDPISPPREMLPELEGSLLNPGFSPDGRRLAFTQANEPGSDGDRKSVRVLDLATGAVRELGAALDRWPNEIVWSADGRAIYARNDDDGGEELYRYPLSGKVERLAAGGVSGIGVSTRGLMLIRSSFAAPPQVFVARADGSALQQVTHVAEAQLAGVRMAPTRSMTFKGWNDDPVQAFVTEPLDREPGKRYPVIFLIHGGPHGVYPDEWSYGRNPQIWAARGYATVMVNFHGSTGFGQKFAHDVLLHRGDRVLEDLQKGWAAALADYPFLDGRRGCAMGSSFGGYMVYWIAGVWNEPWRCLVAHAGTLDSRVYTSDIQWHVDRQMGGAPWENPQGVEEFNAMAHVAQWKTPLLITHGGRDYRVPFDQGLAAFAVAQRLGVPSEMLVMPAESHSVSGAAASIRWYETVDAWLDRWTAP